MKSKDLSIVVSAFNEEKNVPGLLKKLTSVLDTHRINGEIVFLNNHSTDRTGHIADSFSKKDRRVRVIHRYGRDSSDLGSSLKEGFRNARGKYVVIMDADLSHSPQDMVKLYRHRKDADIIVGSRFVRGGTGDMAFSRALISKAYNLLVGLLMAAGVKDITTGFKLYKKEVIENLNPASNGFGLHVELLLKAVHKGYKTKEIPIHYRARKKGKSKLFYRRQFKTYAQPVVEMLRMKLRL
jgi:dolichol-phosphate mannosyltransferase